MISILIAIGSFILYIIAYNTYGKFLARKVFNLDATKKCPSVTMQDDIDYVPTRKEILFGHHFTSIAGTGPIVGPAIAIIWGWLPALIWVLVGSIVMGAVHDFGALVVSVRSQGRSIGDLTGIIINDRVMILFLLIIFFSLWIVVAIFGVVIGACLSMFPQAVFPVWIQIPIAITLGYLIYKKKFPLFKTSFIAVILMYITIIIGSYIPFSMPELFGLSPIAVWVIILLIYAYIASILPVNILLQPRDFINAYQLFIAMILLAIGIFVSHPEMAAPVINTKPAGAPPIIPMLFVVVACGAISGFHSLVSSGTSSKQCHTESDTQFIGYGSMLMEGLLAAFVLISCGAGLALGYKSGENVLYGTQAFSVHYSNWTAAQGLASKINAFVIGATNMIQTIGIPAKVALTIMGVFIVSFAATTLDTATRIQRYIVSELGAAFHTPVLTKKHPATLVAVGTALILAFYNGTGKGALTLWPLFGCTNQLLAGLALLVITIYLAKKQKPVKFTLIPMIFMILMTGWAITVSLKNFYIKQDWLLFIIGTIIVLLEIWMIIESILVLKKSLILTNDHTNK